MATVNTSDLQVLLSYDKLWRLLKERGMRKHDLQAEADISSGSMAKLSKSANIQTNALLRVCQVLDCDIADICEVVPTDTKGETD
ncbi:helix-turn-helix domain-containing protein [Brevibacterium ravenspurgense]|uniref:helix-turn-helix domain-containing protein n=1 Tax=Brevibacterium ravenspurgense TaxID=479117 RepID=UPI0026B82933|nr:helix-turn-helix transcriptional regulator [Brevibacterium ravenspurgense]